MQTIINLTQHQATPEQLAVGVVDLPPDQRKHLRELLTVPASEVLGLAWEGSSLRRVLDIVELAFPSVLEAQARLFASEGGRDCGLGVTTQCHQHDVWHLARNAYGVKAMIGGAPFLVPLIAAELRKFGIEPLLAVSDRITVEEPQPDGTVRKVAVFRHAGFVPHP